MLGYFAPLALWLRKTGTKTIAVRDCGPMNQWFEFLEPEISVEIVKPGVALHTLAGNRSRHHVVTGLDYPRKHKKQQLPVAIEAMQSFLPKLEISSTPILIIDRTTTDDFHSSSMSETEMSGAQRRSTPNLRDVCDEILVQGSFVFADMATIAPELQVSLAQHSQVLVGQHGAGLTHMIWMQKGSTVIEIQPPLPEEAIDVFWLLAKALGHNYLRIPQFHVHANLDSSDLIEAFRSVNPKYLGTSNGS
nr:glycosyltransferase family 61 protein [Arsukibacterium sp.]